MTREERRRVGPLGRLAAGRRHLGRGVETLRKAGPAHRTAPHLPECGAHCGSPAPRAGHPDAVCAALCPAHP